MKHHWTTMTNSPNIEILHKCAERGHLITVSYTSFIYVLLVTYLVAPVMPVILDLIVPLNESRKRNFLYEAEYGVNQDDYFYEILFHSYITTWTTMAILVAVDSLYFVIVEHACGLFEMVGTNIKMLNKSHDRSTSDDFRKICYWVDLHMEALSFTDLIESTYSAAFMLIIGLSLLAMSISALQTLLNINNPEEVVRFGSFVIGQVIHIFFNSIPGQKIIDYSLQVQESIYYGDWLDFHIKNQKLLLIIMMRSQKPCLFTAGKIYTMSMASFSSVMQTAMSYFTVLSSML